MAKEMQQAFLKIECPATRLICSEDLETKRLRYCNDLKKLKVALESGKMDVNARYESGNTMLHLAAKDANSKAMKLLLNNGADFNARSDNNETPLFLIFSSKASNERKRECVESLLLRGADYDVVNSEGDTVVNVALKNGSFFSLQPIVAHLAWLREVGLPVDDTIFYQMSFISVLKQYYRSCTRHLEEMKLTKIEQADVTEYEMLTESDEWIASRMGNSLIVKRLEEHVITSDLYYNNLFNEQVRKALEIKKLRSDASYVFRNSIKIFFYCSHLVVDKIICHLSHGDLKTLKCIVEEEERKPRKKSLIS